MGGVIAQCVLGVTLFALSPGVNAESSTSERVLVYATDRTVYMQGEAVRITVTNTSDVPVTIVDRTRIDGGFAAVERRMEDGRWQAIELYAAANVIAFRTLGPRERHEYLWLTVGYNRVDTLAAPGTYRIRFGQQTCTNQFEIHAK